MHAEVAAARSADAVLLRQGAEHVQQRQEQEGAAGRGPSPGQAAQDLNFPLATYVASDDEQTRQDALTVLSALLKAHKPSKQLQEIARAAKLAVAGRMHDIPAASANGTALGQWLCCAGRRSARGGVSMHAGRLSLSIVRLL